MIETTVYFKIRPSQLVNLETFLFTLMVIPVILFLDELIKQNFPIPFLPETIVNHIYRLPAYLAAAAVLNLAYRVLRVYCIRYEIDPEELKIYSGIFRRKHEYVETYRIKDYRIERPLIYRLFGQGNLILYTSDKTTPFLRLEAIRDPEEKQIILRGLVEISRREKHVFEVD